MMIKVEITTGHNGTTATRTIAIDPDLIPMGFSEDMEEAQISGKWKDLNKVFAEFIGMTHEEFRQVTRGDFKRIMAAIEAASNEAVNGPNG